MIGSDFMLSEMVGFGTSIAKRLNGNTLSILIFHRVSKEPDPLFPGEMNARRFDILVEHLCNRWRIISLGQAIEQLYAGSLLPGSLAITFDDGYADNAEVAFPILKTHGVPATIFVTSGYLGGGRMWNDTIVEAIRRSKHSSLELSMIGYGTVGISSISEKVRVIERIQKKIKHLPQQERTDICSEIARYAEATLPSDLMMTPEQVREIHKSGIEIGAHTVSHPILATLSDSEAEFEIIKGKQDLENIIGSSVDLFAYPNGRPMEDYLPVHVEMVKRAGYSAAVTTTRGAVSAASDSFQIPRFTPWDRGNTAFNLRLLSNFFQKTPTDSLNNTPNFGKPS